MKKQTDTFKRLRAVMKDINGDHRQIIKTMQIYLKYRYLVYHFLTCPVRDKKRRFCNRSFGKVYGWVYNLTRCGKCCGKSCSYENRASGNAPKVRWSLFLAPILHHDISATHSSGFFLAFFRGDFQLKTHFLSPSRPA